MNDSPLLLCKLGKTHYRNIMDRFDPDIHYANNWEGVPLALDYFISPLWSRLLPIEVVDQAEKNFEVKYPKSFWCTTRYNACSELRDWDRELIFKYREVLDEKYPATEQWKKSITESKKKRTINKTHTKLYFIILNKKPE